MRSDGGEFAEGRPPAPAAAPAATSLPTTTPDGGGRRGQGLEKVGAASPPLDKILSALFLPATPALRSPREIPFAPAFASILQEQQQRRQQRGQQRQPQPLGMADAWVGVAPAALAAYKRAGLLAGCFEMPSGKRVPTELERCDPAGCRHCAGGKGFVELELAAARELARRRAKRARRSNTTTSQS